MRLLLTIFLLANQLSAHAQRYYLFIGSYTTTGSKGIYVYSFDTGNGELKYISNTDSTIINPSYLAIAPDHKHIYACTETRTANAGSVSAFSFDKATGALTFINKQPSGGDNPVYLAIDRTNKWVVNGNYTGGSVSVYGIDTTDGLLPCRQLIQHIGSGPNKRQDKAHVHATVFAPGYDRLFVPDLGTDKIINYPFDSRGAYPIDTAGATATITVPGSGPRHFTFAPSGRYAYCVEELGGTVAAYSYTNGQLTLLQRTKSHNKRKQPFQSSDIHISPDGRFLYSSNRLNENTLAIFSINPTDGKLTLAGHQTTYGDHPRNFIIDPSGNYLLVANQISGNIVVFKRDKQTGLLTRTGNIAIPEPSCLQMMAQ